LNEEWKSYFFIAYIIAMMIIANVYNKKIQNYLKEEYKRKSFFTRRIPYSPDKYENKEGLKYRDRYYLILILSFVILFVALKLF
jgi:hypothetical protein